MAKKRKNIETKKSTRRLAEKRNHRIVVLLNDKELSVLESFCKKYKIASKARFVRESAFKTILKKLDSDYPTLFPESEM